MRALRACIVPLVIVALFTFNACGRANRTSAISGALVQRLAGKPTTPIAAVWTDVQTFYAQRENAPGWVTERGTSRAAAAVQVLRTAPDHGLTTADYDEANLSRDLDALKTAAHDAPDASERVQRLAEFDVRVTTALLALGHDVALGRTAPQSADRSWKPRRAAPDFVVTLVQAADGDVGDLGPWLDALHPHHPEYAALQKALKDLTEQKRKGEWPAVPERKFKSGESHPSVATLRQRLAASGQLSPEAAASRSPVYDQDIDAGVRAFQEHHAIKATGIIDAATLDAMNVSLDDRISQVEINLERWRWVPDDFGPRHFLVNIPSFMLMARENGKTVLDSRVIVGKPGHETPIFSGDMATVVFSPYWNVPDSIAEGETAPAAAKDPDYLERNQIEIFRMSTSGSTPVDAEDVDWDDPSELSDLTFRQKPGAANALGHVKFLFPNPYNVYLHDTPADNLFARPGRSFSHGCVRVEEPEAIATYVLRDAPEWDGPKIRAAMSAGVEKHVKLTETIPVHIVYFTVWVDDRSGVHFQPDVYGYDAKQMRSVN